MVYLLYHPFFERRKITRRGVLLLPFVGSEWNRKK